VLSTRFAGNLAAMKKGRGIRNSLNLPFRVVNGFMAALFAFGVVVQYNDPDPLPWMLIYLAAALICIGALARGRVPAWSALGVGLIALLWGLILSRGPSLNEYSHMFDYWEMKSPAAEEAREASGLLIIAAWMAVLTGYSWSRGRVKNDAS
jgi:hypothetical protein